MVSLNDQKQTIYKETSGTYCWLLSNLLDISLIILRSCNISYDTGIKQASLGKNDTCLMLEMDPVMTTFPLLLSFNFCVSTPLITNMIEDGEAEPDRDNNDN